MAKVTFIDANNAKTDVELVEGESLMSLAVNNLVDGIEGECGGVMACATCHCYVEAPHSDYFGAANEVEQAMLEMVEQLKPSSRLACQLVVTDTASDIEIHLPASQ